MEANEKFGNFQLGFPSPKSKEKLKQIYLKIIPMIKIILNLNSL